MGTGDGEVEGGEAGVGLKFQGRNVFASIGSSPVVGYKDFDAVWWRGREEEGLVWATAKNEETELWIRQFVTCRGRYGRTLFHLHNRSRSQPSSASSA